VLPLRGIVVYPWPGLWMSEFVAVYSTVLLLSFSVALVALFAGGLGILGSRVLGRYAIDLVSLGVAASVVALVAGWSPASWWGLSLDALLVGSIAAARNVGLAPVFADEPARPTTWSLRRACAETSLVGLATYIAVATALWPWHRTWGATYQEQTMSLPGDAPQRNPSYELIHGVTIDAPVEAIWPWLAQLGQDRAGFYSYDWLERVFQADVHNADRIHPEWQHHASGEFVRATQPGYLGGALGFELGWRIVHFDPPRAMVLENWGAFVLHPTADGRTRLLIRSRVGGPKTPVWGAALTFAAFQLPHFIMQRRMMLGIKERAEWSSRVPTQRS
jgi:uncharacterized protein YndB with AHSA1/START domain